MASVGYRYRKWDLDGGITLVARCQHDAVIPGPNGEIQYITVKALNEWDPRNNAKSGYQVHFFVTVAVIIQALVPIAVGFFPSSPVEWNGVRNWILSVVLFWLTSSGIMRASWLNGQFRLFLPAPIRLNSGKVVRVDQVVGACLKTCFGVLDMCPVSTFAMTPTMLFSELNNLSLRNLPRKSV